MTAGCPDCQRGELVEGVTDVWMRDLGGRWVLLTNVLTRMCGVCGASSLSQEVAQFLAETIDLGLYEVDGYRLVRVKAIV